MDRGAELPRSWLMSRQGLELVSDEPGPLPTLPHRSLSPFSSCGRSLPFSVNFPPV